MKKNIGRFTAVAAVFAVLFMGGLIGCRGSDGGGGGEPEAIPQETGNLTLTIHWPAPVTNALSSQYLILPSTQWIRVRAKGTTPLNVIFADALAPLPAAGTGAASGTVTTVSMSVPSGEVYQVVALAMADGGATGVGSFHGNPVLLSAGTGTTGTTVPISNGSNAVHVSLTLRQSDVSFTAPTVPLATTTGTSVALTFSSSDTNDSNYTTSIVSDGWPADLYQAAIDVQYVGTSYPTGGSIASVCTMSSGVGDGSGATLNRSCFGNVAPNVASVKLLANIDATSFARNDISEVTGYTLYPDTSGGTIASTNLGVLSASYSVTQTMGSIDVDIQ